LRCCVVGLGYIGLPTAALFAARGHHVVGVDADPRRLDLRRDGDPAEPGLKELIDDGLRSGRLSVAAEVVEADAFLVCVGTPRVPGRPEVALAEVLGAVDAVAPRLRAGNLVVVESTVPPGTTDDVVRPRLEAGSGLACGRDFHLAFCPERVLPGNLVHELVHNCRVVGGVDAAGGQRAAALFRSVVAGDVAVTDARTAEFVKLMENTWSAVNIALANEFAVLAERAGVDVHEAITLAGRHPRVRLMRPGPGVGGHCIPVDPGFLVDWAPDAAPLIRQALATNDAMPRHVADAVLAALAQVGKAAGDARVVLAGVTYKGGVDDVRGSPALALAGHLAAAGASVVFQDPVATRFPHPVVPGLSDAVEGADALVIVADHPHYAGLALELPALAARMRPSPVLVDTRGMVPAADGFLLWRLGRGFVPPAGDAH